MKNIITLDINDRVIGIKQVRDDYIEGVNDISTKEYNSDKLGFDYDRSLKSFTDNRKKSRVISVNEFVDRIPVDAFEKISNSSAKQATAFITKLGIYRDKGIDLDSAFAVDYAAKLLASNLLTADEHAALLA